MDYFEIGKSKIKVSAITLGAMGFGKSSRFPSTNDADSFEVIDKALDAGITTIDTAPVYGFGYSEEIVGRAIKDKRDKFVISTKCGLWWDDDEGSYRFTWDGHAVKRNVSRRAITLEIEKSLKRLGTDYIDIYYTHNPACEPFLTPIEETIDTLLDLKKQGKIREIGASNAEIHHIKSYLARDAVAIVQRRYSMLDRDVEKDILPLCKEAGLAFHAYSPVERGLLSGAFSGDYIIPKGDVRSEAPWWQPDHFSHALDFVEGLKDICRDLKTTRAALAVAYTRAKYPFVSVICGLRKAEHLSENIKGAELKIPKDALIEIDKRLDYLAIRLKG
jgi:methylglyoxal reductase